MDCPKVIRELVLKLLQVGILRCRAFAWSKDPDRCAVEADHVHNLPDLLADYRPEKMQYYWDVERPCFIDSTVEGDRGPFEALWQQLQPLIPAIGVKK
jgi:hypothetical protein